MLSLQPSTVWKTSAVSSQENYFSFRQKQLECRETTGNPEKQLYEYYCYNSVKSINVSHNIESKHAPVWTMNDNSKLQYGLKFPDITETNCCGHSQLNIAKGRTECLF